jgi:hypothetical protein
MDAERFDALARALSAARTRRGFAKTLAGGGLAAVLGGQGASGAEAACKAPGTKCRHATECCSGSCKKRRHHRRGTCRECGGGTSFCAARLACANQGECCLDIQCGAGEHCCSNGACKECCEEAHCFAIDPKLHCFVFRCVECDTNNDCPPNQECNGNVCADPPDCLILTGDPCAPDGPNADCCSGQCSSGVCGTSAEGQTCFQDTDCDSGLVCRGFVCATPA